MFAVIFTYFSTIFYFYHVNLFVFKLARLLSFSRFTFIRSEMTPARAIQQSPSSFLEDSSTSSVHSSQSLEVEAEREQRRLKRYDFLQPVFTLHSFDCLSVEAFHLLQIIIL